jgi:hypothetical protein
MDMNDTTSGPVPLRLPATLLIVGQVLYVVVTLLHTGGEANHHSAIFAAYAASRMWTAVHVAQFACMAIFLAGLFSLALTLDSWTEPARWAGRFSAAATLVTLALYGGVAAVDGVALKQAVNAWANAPETEKAARFATAEAVRWLEWGMRSYEDFALGIALLLLAVAVRRTDRLPRPIAYLTGLAALTYLVQGWLAGSDGFSQAHTVAIVLSEILNTAWKTWLLAVAWMSEVTRPTTSAARRGSSS